MMLRPYVVRFKTRKYLQLCWRGCHWSSKAARTAFIEFFKDRQHKLIRSCPVVPWNDPSLLFVNAGMNQFKPVFLNQKQRPCLRAVNSQKCIRIFGKHNDLDDVGRDGYHHTFFEMLGSWSFGDYFKEEACNMAWTLLTEVYKLPKERIFVTYFGGNPALGLEPDLEVYHAWRKIGIPDERLMSFGHKENFWEMGYTGPCGPSTEIHYIRSGKSDFRKLVNQGSEDVVELWNLVFIQYDRREDGSLAVLRQQHVDTGMGLERLVAALNNRLSNYDTDLFIPLFQAISETSKVKAYGGTFCKDDICLDTAYRILADHVRMMTVALADGMFPAPHTYSLKEVIYQAITLGWNKFGYKPNSGWLQKLTLVVAETLGETYPEIWTKLNHINVILKSEEELLNETYTSDNKKWLKMLALNSELLPLSADYSPKLLDAIKHYLPTLKRLKQSGSSYLPNDIAVKLYTGSGLKLNLIEKFAAIYDLKLDKETFEKELNKLRLEKKQIHSTHACKTDISEIISNLQQCNIPKSDDSAKYSYTSRKDGSYEYTPVVSEVVAILLQGSENSEAKLVKKVSTSDCVGVVLSATDFYYSAGGQEGDTGILENGSTLIEVNSVEIVSCYIIHWGKVLSGSLSLNDFVSTKIDVHRRLVCSQNHTAAHLLNRAIKEVVDVSSQQSSHVSPSYIRLDVSTCPGLASHHVPVIENIIKKWIGFGSEVERETVDLMEALQNPDFTAIPGEVYSDTIHLISSSFPLPQDQGPACVIASVEPCCGTHLHNTAHIGSFAITSMKSSARGVRRIYAVCGEEALKAIRHSEETLETLKDFDKRISLEIKNDNVERVSALKKELGSWSSLLGNTTLTYTAAEKVREVSNHIRGQKLQVYFNEQAIRVVKDLSEKHPGQPVVQFLHSEVQGMKTLKKAVRHVKNVPVFVLAHDGSGYIARAVLPMDVVRLGASAGDWLTTAISLAGSGSVEPHHTYPKEIASYKNEDETMEVNKELHDAIIEAAKQYISKYCP